MSKRIAVFMYQPYCSIQSGNGVIKSLESKYSFKIFTHKKVEPNFFSDVDVICVPGGLGDANSFDFLFKENFNEIKNFVNNGGRYLGICMGAYWAGSHYFNLLNNVDVVQYIKRPNACTRRPHAKHIDVNWLDQNLQMYFYDGCAFVGSDYDVVAKYKNNDPMAIYQDRLGLIGCHPESTSYWYDIYSWLRGKYHNGEHHQLLLDFVDELMKR